MPPGRKPLCEEDRFDVVEKVLKLLERCEQSRALERQPERIAWDIRPRWEGKLINFRSVTHDARQ